MNQGLNTSRGRELPVKEVTKLFLLWSFLDRVEKAMIQYMNEDINDKILCIQRISRYNY